MGYRANVVTSHPTYGSQTFCNWEGFTNDFVPAMEELGHEITSNEAEDYFEISTESLQTFVDGLPDNEEQSISPEHTNSELKDDLKRAIKETDTDYVTWEWF